MSASGEDIPHDVCFVAPKVLAFFIPEIRQTTGGSERQVFLLGRQLATLGKRVVYTVPDWGVLMPDIPGISLHRAFRAGSIKIVALFSLLGVLMRIRTRNAVFRSANAGVFLPVILCRLRGIRVVYMLAHDAETDRVRLRRFFGFWTAMSMRIVFRLAHCIVAQTRSQSRDFECHFSRKPDLILKNLVTIPTQSGSPDIDLIWVGRSEPWKRPEIFLDLLERLPEKTGIMILPRANNPEGERCFAAICERARRMSNVEFLD